MTSDKTLIVGPSWVGDMVMAQGLFKAIKTKFPSTVIDVLAPDWCLAITARMPEINKGISMPITHGQLRLRDRHDLAVTLRNTYQRSFVLPNSYKSALVPYWAKIPQRIGWRGEWRYLLLNKLKVLNKKRWPLMIQRYLALALDTDEHSFQDFLPKLEVSKQDQTSLLNSFSLDNERPVLALCPGAEFGSAKRWPEQYYSQLAKYFIGKGWQVWLFGSAKEKHIADKIKSSLSANCVNLVGVTKLGEALDLLSLAKLVVTNDSGLMHVAAALQRSVIAIYGATDPNFTPPLSKQAVVVREKVPCSPCHKRECPYGHQQCMYAVTPQKIIATAEQMRLM